MNFIVNFVLEGKKIVRKISFSLIFGLTVFAEVASEVFRMKSMCPSHADTKKVIELFSPSTV